MMNRAAHPQASAFPPPRIVAVAGGRAGVGATTIGVNLAIALAQQGQRTVLIDADLARADVARLCSVAATATVADVLAGKRSIHEVLQRGPGGIQLAAGADSAECRSLCSDRSMGRLLSQIEALGRHTDVVVIDVGSAPTELTSRIWQSADRILLVTTSEAAAVMDTYALIKSLASTERPRASLALVINRAATAALAGDVQERISRSCRRFLALDVAAAGRIPFSEPSERGSARLWVLHHPTSSAAAILEQMAGRLLGEQEEASSEAA